MQALRTLLNFLSLLAAILFSAVICFFSIPFFLWVPKIGIKLQQAFGLGWLRIFNIHRTVIGRENLPTTGGYILASNHESMMDIPLLASLGYRFRWISKEQVGKIPILGWTMRAMGCYFVKRDRSSHDLNVMKEVEDGLRNGALVVIFPEGTRSRTGELLPLKKGAFRTAQNTGVPLIPLAISGTFPIAPKGTLPTRNHHVVVRIGKPFSIPPGVPLEPFIDRYREELSKLLSEDRKSDYNR